jgi:hypothetical protein
MTAHLQWQKRGAKMTHEVIVYQTKSKLEQGKMILTPDGTQWRQHRRNLI